MTTLRDLTIGFVGAGNMGQALLAGLRRQGMPAARLLVTESNPKAAQTVRRRFGVAAVSLVQLARRCDVVIVAVKPQDLSPVLAALRRALGPRPRRVLVISIAAGVTLRALERQVGRVAVVRVMPNLPANVGAGIAAVAAGRWASVRHRRIAAAIFQSVGDALELPERCFDAVTAVSGSGPAYFFLIFKALRDAGIAHGLPADVAQRLAVQTALGSARLAQQSSDGLERLIARVASKHGTTEAALKVFARRRLEHTLNAGVAAAAKRSQELSRVYSA